MIPHPNSYNRHPRGYKKIYLIQCNFNSTPCLGLCTFQGAHFQFRATNMKKIPRRQPLHHSKIISSCRIFEDVPNSVVKRRPGACLSTRGEARPRHLFQPEVMEFGVAPTRRAPVHGRQVIKASPDENYMTYITLALRISFKRRLFDFCLLKKKWLIFCLVCLYFLSYTSKKLRGSFVKNIDQGKKEKKKPT